MQEVPSFGSVVVCHVVRRESPCLSDGSDNMHLFAFGKKLVARLSWIAIILLQAFGLLCVCLRLSGLSYHAEKAQEIARRGLRVSSPRGMLFIDEFDFALFEWVAGTPLDHVSDIALWEAYGRFVRTCHERGIAIDDAGGRNALWQDNAVVGIDFEHTWLLPEPVPLKKDDRAVSLTRIEQELRKKPSQETAFFKGYNNCQ